MTRKDYVLIAEALRRAAPTLFRGGDQEQQHGHDCHMIANALAADNPRFDRARFLKAAGVQA